MLGEGNLEPVVLSEANPVLEANATKIMEDMFGLDTVESVKGVSNQFSEYIQTMYSRVSEGFGQGLKEFVSNISSEQANAVLMAGGIGAVAGFALGLALTMYFEKMEEERTGHKPVPRLGIGCSTIPSTTLIGAVGGLIGGLIYSK
ncbi:MAG TPA: hypothetical protein P5059_01005 [Candidatus Dojkabacteria bacterium]|nr:hypothetical protein [Candidatus Dojkabacteria bacterium]